MKKRLYGLTVIAVVLAVGFLTGCASEYMIQTKPMAVAEADFAIVNFIRPSSFGGAIKFGVWDSDNLIGVLTPQKCIQYKASPGAHIFMIRAENWGIIKAKIAAGKTYTIIAEPRMGLMKANVHMEVIKPKDARLAKWMKGVEYVMVDPAKHDAYVKERADDARKAAQKAEAGTAAFDLMSPEDGE
jgi:hypothetical protein